MPPQSPGGQRTAAYAPDALPERHPSFATRIPSGRLALWGASTAVVLLNLVFGFAVLESRPGRSLARWTSGQPVVADAGGFDRSLRTLCETLSPPGPVTGAASAAGLPPLRLPDWLGQSSLFAAAAVALAVRQMRRHRLDDFQGRYRAWGWLSGLLCATAIARQLPLGRLVAAVAADSSGLTLGPDGIGWWLATAAVGWLGVGAWCLLPLERRLASTAWLMGAWTAWLCGAAIDWSLRSGYPAPEWMGRTGSLAILLGDTSILLAMLWAFRTVMQEVRGETPLPRRQPASDRARGGNRREGGGARQEQEAGAATAVTADPDGTGGGRREALERPAPDSAGLSGGEQSSAADLEPDHESDEDFDDAGQGRTERRLSKAERRRLRKQARLDRAA